MVFCVWLPLFSIISIRIIRIVVCTGVIFYCWAVFFCKNMWQSLSTHLLRDIWVVSSMGYFKYTYCKYSCTWVFVGVFFICLFCFKFIFNWMIIALQYWFDFCHTATWIDYRCTCSRSLNPPSHLPPFPISLVATEFVRIY